MKKFSGTDDSASGRNLDDTLTSCDRLTAIEAVGVLIAYRGNLSLAANREQNHWNKKDEKNRRDKNDSVRGDFHGQQTRCEHHEQPYRKAKKPASGMRSDLHRPPFCGKKPSFHELLYALRCASRSAIETYQSLRLRPYHLPINASTETTPGPRIKISSAANQ